MEFDGLRLADGTTLTNLTAETGNTAARPASPIGGQLYFNTDTVDLEVYDGTSAWLATVGSGQWTVSGSDIYYNTGNVGIGQAANAGWAFYDAIQFGDAAAISGDSNYTNITHNLYAYGNNSWKRSTTNIASLYQQAGGDHTFYSAVSAAADSIATPVLQFRVDDAKNAGFAFSPRINQSAADTHLSIGANAQVWATEAAGVSSKLAIGQNVYEHSTGDLYLNTDEASKYEQVNGTHIFNVAVSGTAAATITWTTALSIDNGGQVYLPQTGSATAPSLAIGAVDVGFWANGANTIAFALAGANYWYATTSYLGAAGSGGGAINVLSSSATVPTHVTRRSDMTTGIGGTSGTVSLITGSVERMRIGAAGGVLVAEIAAAEADVAGYGQIWVKSDIPNTLMFTDDAGADFEVAGAVVSAADLGEFIIASLPTASANANSYALATDAAGGRTIVRSDGTNWKIVVVEGATVA